MSNRPNPRGFRRRGVTLLEVLITAIVAVVVFGIAIGVLVSTNRTAKRVIARGSLLQQAQVSIRQVRSVLEGVVWAEDMDTTPVTGAGVGFLRDRLEVFSSHNPTTGNVVCHYSIGYRKGGADTTTAPGFMRQEPGGGRLTFTPLGGEYEGSVEFRYATEIGEGLKPVWRESLPPGEKPRLVWVRVVLRNPKSKDRQGRVDEVQLETAVSL